RIRARVAVELDAREPLGELRRELPGQRIRVLHGVELHQALGLGDVVGAEGQDLRPDEPCGVHGHLAQRRNRTRAASACAAKPSPSARVAATRPSSAAADCEISMRLVRFWKSYTPSGDEKRAVPAVGRTWFGPAQ